MIHEINSVAFLQQCTTTAAQKQSSVAAAPVYSRWEPVPESKTVYTRAPKSINDPHAVKSKQKKNKKPTTRLGAMLSAPLVAPSATAKMSASQPGSEGNGREPETPEQRAARKKRCLALRKEFAAALTQAPSTTTRPLIRAAPSAAARQPGPDGNEPETLEQRTARLMRALALRKETTAALFALNGVIAPHLGITNER